MWKAALPAKPSQTKRSKVVKQGRERNFGANFLLVDKGRPASLPSTTERCRAGAQLQLRLHQKPKLVNAAISSALHTVVAGKRNVAPTFPVSKKSTCTQVCTSPQGAANRHRCQFDRYLKLSLIQLWPDAVPLRASIISLAQEHETRRNPKTITMTL